MVTAGVLISGSGTNLQAILDRVADGTLDCRIRSCISNRAGGRRPRARRARRRPDPRHRPPRRSRRARPSTPPLVDALRDAGVELVVLAGFDRLVTRVLLDAFPRRVMNIHPALLPAFKGLHAQRQALEYGVRIAGATVHFVDEQTDHGPIILQGAVVVAPDDTEETPRAAHPRGRARDLSGGDSALRRGPSRRRRPPRAHRGRAPAASRLLLRVW